MSDTSGPTSRTPFAFYDPDFSLVKMCQGTFLSDLMPSSVTLPPSGSMRSGALYALPMSAPVTGGPGSSCLPTPRTLPTPTAGDAASSGSRQGASDLSLTDVVQRGRALPSDEPVVLLPTPTARTQDRTPEEAALRHLPGRLMGRNGGASPDLPSVAALLPTPTAWEQGSDSKWDERVAALREKGYNGNGAGMPLDVAVNKLPPTPTTSDAKGPSPNHGGTTAEAIDRLLPTPAAWDGERGPDYAKMGREDSGGDDLVTSVAKLLPTPDAALGLGGHERRGGARGEELLLSGLAKEVSRGEPTDPPSPVTPQSPDDGPLTLWTDGDA